MVPNTGQVRFRTLQKVSFSATDKIITPYKTQALHISMQTIENQAQHIYWFYQKQQIE